MFSDDPSGRGGPVPSHRTWNLWGLRKMAAPSAGPRPGGGSAPKRRPALDERLRVPGVRDLLKGADVIDAVDAETGERCGLFHGDPATESLPIDHLEPWRRPAVVEVLVNALSDDREVLAEVVWDIKGSCTYPAGE